MRVLWRELWSEKHRKQKQKCEKNKEQLMLLN